MDALSVAGVVADSYLERFASNLRTLLNSLKRNDELAAVELGISTTELKRYLNAEIEMPFDLIKRAVDIWPVNERDFFPLHDDTSGGVRVMRGSESEKSARVIVRGGTPYYEYRDTAMSRVSMIRPEWVKMLVGVSDNDPLNPAVMWNDGHFLFQITYFVGPVNFYYVDAGQKCCVSMNTGDSAFLAPYIPHSFASRSTSEEALILALTFGGRLSGEAQNELAVLPFEALDRFAPDSFDYRAEQWHLLSSLLSNLSMPLQTLAVMAGLSLERLTAISRREIWPSMADLQAISNATEMPLTHLIRPHTDPKARTVFRRAAAEWAPSGERDAALTIARLASSPIAPYSHCFEYVIVPGRRPDCILSTGLHQYIYNVGKSVVSLTTTDGDDRGQVDLAPGDSVYIKPFVAHRFYCDLGPEPEVGKLLVLRIGGKIVGDAAAEALACGRTVLRRVAAESTLWYDPAGGNTSN